MALLILISTGARTAAAAAALPPGLFLEYRVESFSEGRRSVERFRVEVREALDAERRLLELRLGSGGVYRAVYDGGAGPANPFAAERFTRVESLSEGQWQPLAAADLELLAQLAAMQARIAGGRPEADSTLTLADRSWSAKRYSLSDSSATVQQSASVTLTRRVVARGSAWITEALPFGGWLQYDEERRARKISEFGGRRFEGAEETSRERWTLVAAGVPGDQ